MKSENENKMNLEYSAKLYPPKTELTEDRM